MKLRMNATFYLNVVCALDLRNEWITNSTNKTPNFIEMDTTSKFKVLFYINHRITDISLFQDVTM